MVALRSLLYVGFVFVLLAAWFMNQRKRSNLPDYDTDSLLDDNLPKVTGEGIEHPHWRHRLKSVKALQAQERNPETLNILIDMLDDPVFDIREEALLGIVQYGDDAIPKLDEVLASGSLDAREAAIEAVCKVGTPKTIPTLIKALQKDESSWIRIPAAIGLGELGGEEASFALLTALEDHHPDVVQAVEAALHANVERETLVSHDE